MSTEPRYTREEETINAFTVLSQYKDICTELRIIGEYLKDLNFTLNTNMVRITEKSVPMRTHIITLVIALGVSNINEIMGVILKILSL